MAEFSQIQSIQTLVSDCKEHAKACIKLRVAGAAETLSITCSSLDQAESLADLIDGYCRLVTGSNTSLWNRKGKAKIFIIVTAKNISNTRSYLRNFSSIIKKNKNARAYHILKLFKSSFYRDVDKVC